MSRPARFFLVAGALVLAAGVALGAIGAHAARSAAHPEAARLVQTAVLYQLVHGLGLLAVAALARDGATSRLLVLSGALMALGILSFCGSLYVLAFANASLGLLAPLGGVAFMASWAVLAAWALRGGT